MYCVVSNWIVKLDISIFSYVVHSNIKFQLSSLIFKVIVAIEFKISLSMIGRLAISLFNRLFNIFTACYITIKISAARRHELDTSYGNFT